MKTGGAFYYDIVVLAGIFFILFFIGIYFGKSRLAGAIIAFFPTVLLFKTFPLIDKLIFFDVGRKGVLNKAGIFLVLFALLNIILSRYIFNESGYGKARVFHVGGLAVAGVILFLIFSYTIVDITAFHDFSTNLDALFSESRIFWWNLVPIVLLAIL